MTKVPGTGVVDRVDSESMDRSQLEELVREWRRETKLSSDLTEVLLDPSYQRIIDMGPRVLPLVVESLRQRLDLWFWALEAITGDNPAKNVEAGDLEATRCAWLDWADAVGLAEPAAVGAP